MYITIEDKKYLITKGNENYGQPHIEDLNGEIPKGQQRSLLFTFLKQNNIEPPEYATTHWCVNKVLSMEDTPDSEINIKSTNKINFLPLTVENIEKQNKLVLESNNYG